MNTGWIISYLALWLIVVFLTISVILLARQVALIYRRLGPAPARMENEGPKIGQLMESIEVLTINGTKLIVGGERHRHQLLVFVSATCSSCDGLAPALRTTWKTERGKFDLVLASMSDEMHTQAFVGRNRLQELPCLINGDLSLKYNVFSPPYAVLLDEIGFVRAKGVVNNLDHIDSLLNAADMGHPSVESYVRSLREATEVAIAE